MDEMDLLKQEMEKLASHLEQFEDELEGEVMAGILRCLLEGFSCSSVVEEFDLQLGGL